MSVTHIRYAHNDGGHGSLLKSALDGLESGLETLQDVLSTMSTMIDGDGSDEAHYSYMKERFGFTSNADAMAAFNELNSLASKLTGNGSVSNVNAALLQAFNKFR